MSLAFQRLEGTCLLLTIKTQHGLSCFQDITYEYISRRYAEVAEWVEGKLTVEGLVVYIGACHPHVKAWPNRAQLCRLSAQALFGARTFEKWTACEALHCQCTDAETSQHQEMCLY